MRFYTAVENSKQGCSARMSNHRPLVSFKLLLYYSESTLGFILRERSMLVVIVVVICRRNCRPMSDLYLHSLGYKCERESVRPVITVTKLAVGT